VTSMPRPQQLGQNPDGAAREEVVLGVDTHKDLHVAAVVSMLGALLGSQSFPATAAGYRQLLAWALAFGPVNRAGVECTGSYGAALARHLRTAGVAVAEVNQPDKAARRRRGKTDAIDAEAAARAALSGQACAVPKSGDGHAEAVRAFKMARDSAVKSRTQAINQLKALLVTADPAVREPLAGLTAATLIRACTSLADPPGANAATLAAVYALRLLARRIRQLSAEASDLEKRITEAVRACAGQLLEPVGIGPDSAAALLIAAGDNPERLRSEASFAALCGASPVQASSGKTQRHRLNRGGDRQANAALHRIVISRLRWDPRARDYLERRQAQGKTRREAIRCLKRYAAREIYNLIQPERPAGPPATT
jgi:transposase